MANMLEQQLAKVIVYTLAISMLWLRLPILIVSWINSRFFNTKKTNLLVCSPNVLNQWEKGHRFIKIGGVKYHYVECGCPLSVGKRQLVLCLHDHADFWFGFRHQLKALADQGLWIIALDLKGSGDSDRPGPVWHYRLDLVTREVLDLLDLLDVDQVCVVGHGLGASIGWHLAASHPRRVHKLVAIASTHPRVARGAIVKHLASNLFLFYYRLPFVGEMELCRSGWRCSFEDRFSFDESKEQREEVVKAYDFTFVTHDDWRGVLGFYRVLPLLELEAFDVAELNDEKHRIRTPTLFIVGDKDPHTDLKLVCRSSELVSAEFTLKVVEGCGHAPHQERPEEVNQMLLDALTDFSRRPETKRSSSSLIGSLYRSSMSNVNNTVSRVTNSCQDVVANLPNVAPKRVLQASSSPSLVLRSAIMKSTIPIVWGLRKSLSLEALNSPK